MPEITYTEVVWTAGDTITEAKLDNMVANDRAVDSMYNGVEFTERANPATPGANKVHFYAKDKNGVSTLYAINDAGTVYEIGESRPAFFFSLVSTLIAGANQTPYQLAPRDLTITKASARVKTAPTGADLIIDLNINGTSIWNTTQANRLTIAAGTLTDTQTEFDDVTMLEDDYLSLDLDQVGSTVQGADLSVYLRCKY